jgi:hypothetical protein
MSYDGDNMVVLNSCGRQATVNRRSRAQIGYTMRREEPHWESASPEVGLTRAISHSIGIWDITV